MQFQTVDEIERSLVDEHHEGEQVAPGVTISRRQLLFVSSLALVWIAMPSALRAQSLASRDKATGERIEVVMAEVKRLADALIADPDNADEETYLKALAKLVERMRLPGEPWNGWTETPWRWAMDAVWYSPPVILYQLKFEPDAIINLHDHRHYNGLLLGMEGEIEVRNFDFVPDPSRKLDLRRGVVPPVGEEFLIRQTAKQTLLPGQISTLTRDRDNLHVVKAGPKGGVCLDLFTHFNRQARSYEMEWDDKPVSGSTDTFRAAWSKQS